jgi:predicted nucleotidyltransferase
MRIKNRDRVERGKLKSFDDLPESKKNIFLDIKNEVSRFFSHLGDEPVYVYGSHLWGNWDEESDYDVYVKSRFIENVSEFYQKLEFFKSYLETKLKVKVDIVMMRDDIGILIP